MPSFKSSRLLFLAQELRKRSRMRGREVPLHEVKPTTDKIGRIQSLQAKVQNGLLFSKRHRTLLEQLRQFPKGAHDDGPDALQMAVGLASTHKKARIITLDWGPDDDIGTTWRFNI